MVVVVGALLAAPAFGLGFELAAPAFEQSRPPSTRNMTHLTRPKDRAQQAAPLRWNMTFNPDIHHRRSIRLREYDYATVGAYFVTICVHGRECLFGDVVNDEMRLSDAGQTVAHVWSALSTRFPDVTLDEHMVMPNHFHGIVIIDNVGAPLAAPAFQTIAPVFEPPAFEPPAFEPGAPGFEPPASAFEPEPDAFNETKRQGAASGAPTLGKIIRVFKSISAIETNRVLDRQGRPLWQRNYYERVIRNDAELAATREYIHYNPLNWPNEEEYVS